MTKGSILLTLAFLIGIVSTQNSYGNSSPLAGLLVSSGRFPVSTYLRLSDSQPRPTSQSLKRLARNQSRCVRYSETRVDVSRSHPPQLDATNRERRILGDFNRTQ